MRDRLAAQRKIIVISAFIAQSLAVLILHWVFPNRIIAVTAVLPVILAGYLWGTRGGLVAAVIAGIINLLLLSQLEVLPILAILHDTTLFGTLTLLFIGGTVGYLSDLSQRLEAELRRRRSAESALFANQQYTEKIVRMMPGIIYIYDLQKQATIYTNERITDLLGYTAVDTQQMGTLLIPQLIHPDDITRWQNIDPMTHPGDFRDMEYRVRHADGRWLWMSDRNTIFAYDALQKPTQILGIIQDVSAHKAAEQHQQALDFERERLLALIQFVRHFAHDFRNPITTINTSLFLLQHAQSPEDQQRQLETIKRQSRHLEKLITAMHTLVRLENKEQLEKTPTPVDSLIETVLHEVQPASGQQIVLELAEPAPQIEVDADEMTRALSHLLVNALQHTSVDDTIRIRTGAENGHICISVEDTGEGIPPDDLPHVFESFYRTDRDRTRSQGVGLGLTIAQRIVELHQGTVQATSQPGKGSRFVIRLPLT
jgi:PAS domain S-box-containing protein